MNCKFCNAQIEDDAQVCPVCNKALADDAGEETTAIEDPVVTDTVTEVESAETDSNEQEIKEETVECEQPAPKKKKTVLITAIVCSAIVLLGAIGVGLWFGVSYVIEWIEGGPFGEDDVMAKTVYTAEAEEALETADKVVAKVGDKKLTNRQLQVFYWMEVMTFVQENQYYLSYYGLDVTLPLSEQYISEDGLTWEQYFLDKALTNWHYYQCMVIEAEKNGFTLSEELQESIDGISTSMEANLSLYGFETVDEMIQQDMGAIATLDGYLNYVRMYYTGAEYGASLYLQIQPTPEEVEAYWNTNGATVEETYSVNKESGPLVDVRHILISVETSGQDEEGNAVSSEEDWANCLKEAEDILAEWIAGSATEEDFALLANQYSTDPGSNTMGGLYSYVYKGQMVEDFDAWCFDESRKPGDYGIVRSDYGYHIIYFVSSGEGWFRRSEQMLIEDTCTQILTKYMEENPLLVSYANIMLSSFSLL